MGYSIALASAVTRKEMLMSCCSSSTAGKSAAGHRSGHEKKLPEQELHESRVKEPSQQKNKCHTHGPILLFVACQTQNPQDPVFKLMLSC